MASTIYFAASMVLALVGLYALLTSRNMLRAVIGLEVITSAVNLNILAMGSTGGTVDPLAQSMAFTSIVIGAAVAALALSLVIYAYRHYGSIDLRRLRRLRW
ncbi:MAG: NADH-quinone oxidoreductase subunit K [Candidatus Bathyarchaeia archaeon]